MLSLPASYDPRSYLYYCLFIFIVVLVFVSFFYCGDSFLESWAFFFFLSVATFKVAFLEFHVML